MPKDPNAKPFPPTIPPNTNNQSSFVDLLEANNLIVNKTLTASILNVDTVTVTNITTNSLSATNITTDFLSGGVVTNSIITDSSNNVAAKSLFSSTGLVSVNGSTPLFLLLLPLGKHLVVPHLLYLADLIQTFNIIKMELLQAMLHLHLMTPMALLLLEIQQLILGDKVQSLLVLEQ